MKRYGRLIGLVILLVPLLLAAYGWTLLRESSYYILYFMQPDGSLDGSTLFWQLVWHIGGGFLLFLSGLSFLGGFFLHRHRKRSRARTAERNPKPNDLFRQNTPS